MLAHLWCEWWIKDDCLPSIMISAAAPAWRASSPFSTTMSRGELESGFAMERMERNAKINVKASVTRKCMFWKSMCSSQSWYARLFKLVLLSYPSSRRCKSRGNSLWAQRCQWSNLSQVSDFGLISTSPIYRTRSFIGWAAIVTLNFQS